MKDIEESTEDKPIISSIKLDTLRFKTLIEIHKYYNSKLDSISTIRKNQISNVQNSIDVDSLFFNTQWEKDTHISLFLRKNHSSKDDLKGLMEILRARNISTYEKLEIFNSFPWEQQKSDIGNFIKNQLEAVFKKEKTLFFDESLMKHKFSMLGGNDFSIGEINTAYIFLEFWASWCLPCRVGNKEINKNAEFVTGNKNVSMVAISIDKDKEKWVKAIKQDSLKIFKYHLSDNKGWNSSFLKTLQIDAIPYNILITRSGKVINANISKDKIIEAIQKLSN